MTDDSVDVYVLGTGMVGYHQLTQEAEQLLDQVERVYLLHPLPEVREFIRSLCQSVMDLTEEYKQGSDRSRSYETMARRVVDGAVDASGPIAFVLYGHPTVGVTPTRLVEEMADESGLRTEITPGVSSLDCLYTDLSLNPFARGLQLFEATDLLVYDIDLDPATPAFVVQIGLTGTRLYDDRDSTPERFTPLKEHLLQFYPPKHEVSLVRTATHPLATSEQISVPIEEFETIAEDVDNAHTLFIPAACNRTVPDEELAEKVYSEEHLSHITKDPPVGTED